MGGGQLRGHAAAAALGAGAAGQRLEGVVDLDDLLDQGGRGVETGIGGEQAGRVGEEHEQVGGQQVRHQRGEPIVVAEADLVVGDGVVLVHHRHHAEVEQPAEGGPGVEVLLADREVERREEHLAADQAVGGQRALVHPHEAGLAHRRCRLERDGVARPGSRRVPEGGEAGGDGAGGHQDEPMALGAQAGRLGAELGHRGFVDLTVGGGDRRRADLGDDDH